MFGVCFGETQIRWLCQWKSQQQQPLLKLNRTLNDWQLQHWQQKKRLRMALQGWIQTKH
jgi:hypothetical protein